ncbi:MAG: hypothetical protein QXQ02_00735 [Halobacteria archaeon]
MKESKRMFLHYVSGLIILVTGFIHLISNNLPGIGTAIHESAIYPVNLIVLLSALMYHMLNGARVILMELIPGRCAAKAITWIVFLVGIALYIYGLQVFLNLFWPVE